MSHPATDGVTVGARTGGGPGPGPDTAIDPRGRADRDLLSTVTDRYRRVGVGGRVVPTVRSGPGPACQGDGVNVIPSMTARSCRSYSASFAPKMQPSSATRRPSGTVPMIR